jgi:hypothetical protein
VAGITAATILSTLAGALDTATAVSIPPITLLRGTINANPYILSLLEVVTSGANCPPTSVYPAYGQRGTGASRTP